MTNAELIDLLREAQPWIQRDSPVEATDLLMRIDAALAEHDAVPLSEEQVALEWIHDNTRTKLTAVARYEELSVGLGADADYVWRVWVKAGQRHHMTNGRAATLDEAKSAAIAAARGMR